MRSRGYSIIELMVVVVIIGIIVVISIPVANSFNNKYDKAVRQVAGVVKEGREKAITRGDTMLVCFNKTGSPGSYAIYRYVGGSAISTGVSGTVHSDISLNSGAYTQMMFVPLGSLDTLGTNADSVTIIGGDKKVVVKVIQATGIARIIKY